MARKSWRLDRRTFLRGAGLTLGLPLLESMTWGKETKALAELPRRMCGVYFPFGVSLPAADHEHAAWNWFPNGEGQDFQFTNTLKALEPLRQDVTVLSGLSHANGRKMGGHDTGDTFLTGALLEKPLFNNTISLDQLAAEQLGGLTRLSSLTLSSDGGVGEPTRATTLSFSREGRPIPALANPQQIFARMFGQEEADARRKAQLQNTRGMLDQMLESAHSLRGKLGQHDQRKFDEYLASVRAVEQRTQRVQQWLDVPKPVVDPKTLTLNASPEEPLEYIRVMYDLMFLAFQTDTTRLATYMLGQVAGATTIANAFPACIDLSPNWHGLAHGAGKKGGAEKLGRFDQFLADQFAYFLQRLKNTPEGDGSMLDRTLVLYGSSNSRTHNNRNYPLVLAGGRKLGLKHGQYLKLSEKTPLANVFVTMLERMGLPNESFADSTGEMTELLG